MFCYHSLDWDSGYFWLLVRMLCILSVSLDSFHVSADVGNSRLRKINGLCAVHFKYPQLKAMTLIYSKLGYNV